ncbi:unnamed protein product [Agarophyton chilense]
MGKYAPCSKPSQQHTLLNPDASEFVPAVGMRGARSPISTPAMVESLIPTPRLNPDALEFAPARPQHRTITTVDQNPRTKEFTRRETDLPQRLKKLSAQNSSIHQHLEQRNQPNAASLPSVPLNPDAHEFFPLAESTALSTSHKTQSLLAAQAVGKAAEPTNQSQNPEPNSDIYSNASQNASRQLSGEIERTSVQKGSEKDEWSSGKPSMYEEWIAYDESGHGQGASSAHADQWGSDGEGTGILIEQHLDSPWEEHHIFNKNTVRHSEPIETNTVSSREEQNDLHIQLQNLGREDLDEKKIKPPQNKKKKNKRKKGKQKVLEGLASSKSTVVERNLNGEHAKPFVCHEESEWVQEAVQVDSWGPIDSSSSNDDSKWKDCRDLTFHESIADENTDRKAQNKELGHQKALDEGKDKLVDKNCKKENDDSGAHICQENGSWKAVDATNSSIFGFNELKEEEGWDDVENNSIEEDLKWDVFVDAHQQSVPSLEKGTEDRARKKHHQQDVSCAMIGLPSSRKKGNDKKGKNKKGKRVMVQQETAKNHGARTNYQEKAGRDFSAFETQNCQSGKKQKGASNNARRGGKKEKKRGEMNVGDLWDGKASPVERSNNKWRGDTGQVGSSDNGSTWNKAGNESNGDKDANWDAWGAIVSENTWNGGGEWADVQSNSSGKGNSSTCHARQTEGGAEWETKVGISVEKQSTVLTEGSDLRSRQEKGLNKSIFDLMTDEATTERRRARFESDQKRFRAETALLVDEHPNNGERNEEKTHRSKDVWTLAVLEAAITDRVESFEGTLHADRLIDESREQVFYDLNDV